MMSRTIHKQLNRVVPVSMRVGFRRLALAAIPSMRHLDMWTRLGQLQLNGFNPGVIYDVGASHGDWAKASFELWPAAKIVGFEPNESRRSYLDGLVQENQSFRYYSCFLGSEERHVNYNDMGDQTSLFLGGNEGSCQARMRTLDNLIQAESLPAPELIKLDVQGAELDVLRGGLKALESVQFIVSEVSLYHLRDDMPLAFQMWQWLEERGFALYDVVSMLRRETDDALLQMDFVFVRKSNALFRDTWT
jgi:FkbM family methyltransferase